MHKPLAHAQERLVANSPARFWGSFVPDPQSGVSVLFGSVGLDGEQRLKSRHKAVVIGM